RERREAAILRALAAGETDIPALVRAIYVGLDPRLVKAAGLSVFAHLEDLAARRRVATDGELSIEGPYRLAWPSTESDSLVHILSSPRKRGPITTGLGLWVPALRFAPAGTTGKRATTFTACADYRLCCGLS